jgi:FSR family fosmidomycin resistance protein-like MFS transporter
VTNTIATGGQTSAEKMAFIVILAVSFCHMLNDVMQSLLTAIYPILKSNYGLDFVEVGLLSFTFQCTASLLQPLIGTYTDKRPLPYSISAGMGCTLIGLAILGFARNYGLLLAGSAFVGLGSSVFHPESSRVARLASGGRHGLAQSLFQLGGNFGTSLGPLLAAVVVLPHGQTSVAWFSVAALLGMVILWRVGNWYAQQRAMIAHRQNVGGELPFPKKAVVIAIIALAILTFSKNIYLACFSNFYTFYLIHRFGLSISDSQFLLFIFLGASAAGTIVGGPIGDRFGAVFVIWFSILGVLPLTLALPYADLIWTTILSVAIGLILSSAFPAIVVFAQELVPGRVGAVAGLFFGFAFGIGGIAAAALGALADAKGIEYVFWICSFLPMLGLLTVLLPRKSAL